MTVVVDQSAAMTRRSAFVLQAVPCRFSDLVSACRGFSFLTCTLGAGTDTLGSGSSASAMIDDAAPQASVSERAP